MQLECFADLQFIRTVLFCVARKRKLNIQFFIVKDTSDTLCIYDNSV